MHFRVSCLFSLFPLFLGKNLTAQHISTFTSVTPGAQTALFRMPSTHVFQYLLEEGDALTIGGSFPTAPDFSGYVPLSGSSTQGFLGINSEVSPAGNLTVLNIHFDFDQDKWLIDQSGMVDFTPVEGTRGNCSGGITPWGTILSCEENKSSGSTNAAGYFRYGYCVEVNPSARSVANYSGGLPSGDKVWKMGYGSHENACVRPGNSRVLYTGLDETTGYLYKFVTDSPSDLGNGKLYVLKKITASTGQWKRVQNTTVANVNATATQSAAVGGQTYNGIEDVEVGPDGKVYFAVKNENSVYRFTDVDPLGTADSSVTNFETYVGGTGTNYTIATAGGPVSAAWGTGNDNLAFDNLGNLWVLQDGDNNAIWMVQNGHTQASPLVKYFGNAPAGAEPTGITFTPDYRYMFLSFQHPSATNNADQDDAFSVQRDFNKGVTLVMARSEYLGATALPIELTRFDAKPNKKSIEIYWETASEANASHFTVERMNDRLGPWEPIGSLQAVGTSTVRQSYFLEDDAPFVGGNYYRLRQHDLDGGNYLSDVELAYFFPANRGSGGRIYPNPVINGILQGKVDLQTNEPLTATVIDALGIVRMNVELDELTGGNFRLDAGDLRTGCYFLQIRSAHASVMESRFFVE